MFTSRKTKSFVPTRVYDFNKMRPGTEFGGPAIIETPVTTVVVNPGDRAAMDRVPQHQNPPRSVAMALNPIVSSVDPITFEILSHRVYQIAKEMGSTLERVGGTVNTTQMHDYMASLYLANGDVLSAGDAMGWHVACAGFAVKRIIERFENDGGIYPDDIFLLNDPYVAAIHQSDVYMISPIHFKGKLMGWSATFVHVMDIGAMSPGGNSPGATEICHEGIRIPGIKLVERGELRKDFFDAFINMTRQPVMVGLDLKCEIAANNVAKSRMQALFEQFGPELVTAVSRGDAALLRVDLEKKNRGDSRRHLERDRKHSCRRYLECPRDSQQARRTIAVRLYRQQPAGQKGHQLALPCDLRRVL